MVKPKKHLGQHFLHDKNIARKIAGTVTGRVQNVLEIGPGTGMLTRFLLERGFRLKVVEMDSESVNYLLKNNIIHEDDLIAGDFLKLDLSVIFNGEPFVITGNFPYNISSQIVFKALENRAFVPEFTGMFQKEVAERLVEAPGSKTYGILSVMVQAWYEAEYLFQVPPTVFLPPPKVMSAVVRLTRKPDFQLNCDEKVFKQVVKTAFNTRRKMLRSSLKKLTADKSVLSGPFFEQRPEQLTVADFVKITNLITGRKQN